MQIFEPVVIGLGQIATNKLRSLLSLTGILIAVGSVIGVLALGDGLQRAIVGEFDKSGGASTIYCYAPSNYYRDDSGQWVKRDWEEYLTQRDMEAIMAASDKVEFIAPWINMSGTKWNVAYRAASVAGQILCTTPFRIYGMDWEVEKGRFINNLDMVASAKVCVLGHTVAQDLFGEGRNPVGRQVRIGNGRYTVIGVMAAREFFGDNSDDQTMIPITTAQQRISGNERVGGFRVKAKSIEDVPEVAQTIRRVYRRLHVHGDDFEIRTLDDLLKDVNQLVSVLKIILGSVAGISLLVGGIGIMNIMLVSVTERTYEIGIRKALGAKRAEILWQFLVEAVVLCLMGGLLGILLGLLIGKGAAAYIESISPMTFNVVFSVKMMVFAVTFSLGIGTFFGVYPAWIASRLSPADALRKE